MAGVVLIDPSKDGSWDSFVEAHPFGWVSHLEGWRRVIEGSIPRAKAFHFALLDGGQIVAGIPVYLLRGILQKWQVVSIPMATIADLLAETAEQGALLLKAVADFSHEKRAGFLEIRALNSAPLFPNDEFSVIREYKHHFIRLDRPPELLMKRFDRTCVRQRISRSSSSGVVVKGAADEAAVREFFRLYVLTRRRLGLPPQPYGFIRSLWETFSRSGHLAINLAEYRGENVAGILVLKMGKRLSAEYLVSDERFREFNPNHILLWDAIQTACREGREIFDFGRTHVENDGLMDFKKRWGTEVVDLPMYYYPKDAKAVRPAERSGFPYSWGSTALKRMPTPLFTMVGRAYYRYVA